MVVLALRATPPHWPRRGLSPPKLFTVQSVILRVMQWGDTSASDRRAVRREIKAEPSQAPRAGVGAVRAIELNRINRSIKADVRILVLKIFTQVVSPCTLEARQFVRSFVPSFRRSMQDCSLLCAWTNNHSSDRGYNRGQNSSSVL